MKFPSLNAQIMIGVVLGLGLGMGLAALGTQSPVTQNGLYVAGLIGTLFVDLLKMVLMPLVFASISVGVANLRAHQQIHRVWVITLGFFVLSMAIAIVLGLSSANLFEPGEGLHLSMFADATRATFRPSRCRCRSSSRSCCTACSRTRWRRWRRATCCRSWCSR